MKKIRFAFLFFFLFVKVSWAQMLFYSDTIHGGTTGGGLGNNATGTINLHIEPGSSIRKAFLFAGRQGTSAPLTVTMNSVPITFDTTTNQVTPTFQSIHYGGNSGVHAVDVTSIVSPTVTSYTLSSPFQFSSPFNCFSEFYLFVEYENPSLSFIHTQVYLNNLDFSPDVIYSFKLDHPVNPAFPVSVALFLGYVCSSGDTSTVFLNGNLIGGSYGPDAPSGTCAGPFANYYYQDCLLSALGNDHANINLAGPDALTDVASLLSTNDTVFNMRFTHHNSDNAQWGFFITYCAAARGPSAAFISSDTTFCNESGSCIDFFDQSTNNPTGWKWNFPGAVPDTSTQQNPTGICYSTPGTYAVKLIVSNSNGSDSLTVSPMIKFAASAAAPVLTFSGDTIYCSHATAYQWYLNGLPIAGATDSFYVAAGDGVYSVLITDGNGCTRLSSGFPVSVNELSGGSGVRIYPNPARNELWVESYGLWVNSHAKLEILNVLGEIVYNAELATHNSQLTTRIDVSSLTKGVYIVEVRGGEKFFRGKFVKE